MKIQIIPISLLLAMAALLADATIAPAQSAGVEVRPDLAIQMGHARGVKHLAVSGDGKLLASIGFENSVILWNAQTGGELRVIPYTQQVDDIAFHPSKPWLVIASHNLMIYDVTSGMPMFNTAYSSEFISYDAVAFSNDGHWLAAGLSQGAIKIWNADTLFDTRASEPKILEGHEGGVASIAFSPDNRWLVSGGYDKTVRIWDLTGHTPPQKRTVPDKVNMVLFSPTGKEFISAYNLEKNATVWRTSDWQPIRTLPVSVWSGNNMAYSPDGAMLATADPSMERIQLLDTKTWRPRATTEFYPALLGGVVFSPDGRWIASGRNDGVIHVTDVANQRVSNTLAGSTKTVKALALSYDGRQLASTDGHAVRMWNLGTGEELSGIPKNPEDFLASLAFSPDGKSLAAGTSGAVRVWNLETGEHQTISTGKEYIKSLAFSPNGNLIATGSSDGLQLWSARNGHLEKSFVHAANIGADSVTFDSDGTFVAAANSDESASVWEVLSGKEHVFKMRGPGDPPLQVGGDKMSMEEFATLFMTLRVVGSLAFSHDNKALFTGVRFKGAIAWDIASGAQMDSITPKASSDPPRIAISPDGHLLVSDDDGGIDVWNLDLPKEAPKNLRSLGEPVQSLMFHPGGRCLVSFGTTGPISFRDVRTEDNWVQLVPFDGGGWVAVDSQGRFDTNNLDEIRGVRWIFPDEPFRDLPAEVFMRDYYQPRLLSRLVRGETLPEIRSLSQLNRTQPEVTLLSVAPEPEMGRASVTVRVRSSTSEVQKDKTGKYLESGAFDLRLFRDGQLVAQWPEPRMEEPAPALGSRLDLDSWRKLHEIQLHAGEYTHTFHNVNVPLQSRTEKVRFTAYAFNSDRVKSLTTPPLEYVSRRDSRASQPKTSRRAYLIGMGVNANESRWHLHFAVQSAQDAVQLLHEKLASEYEVIDVSLFSTLAEDSPRAALQEATKARLKSVLDLLAGRSVDPVLRKAVDPDGKLRPATPDDAVFLYVASHGYADPQGKFYVVPYDTGNVLGITEDLLTRCQARPEDESLGCKRANAFLEHTISSQEFAQWWSGVDAGEMVMILDSCHSAAAPGREFRPGPLGDPGLGQLSYDKRMRILAATQTDKTARATLQLDHSLLVEALVQEAKLEPQGTIDEWLHATVGRVPSLAHQLYPELDDVVVQVPELFDFGVERVRPEK